MHVGPDSLIVAARVTLNDAITADQVEALAGDIDRRLAGKLPQDLHAFVDPAQTAKGEWASPMRQKAQPSAANKKTISHLPSKTRTALAKQGAAVARRKRTGGTSPKTRAELHKIARQRDLSGRSKMGRDELARKLGES